MNLNLKRGILTGTLSWVLIFFEVSILMFGFGLTTGPLYYTLHYILSAIIVAISALIYFKNEEASLLKGLSLGVLFVIVGVILDSIITVPLFVKDYNFFLDIYLIAGLIEGIIVTSIVGFIKR